MNEDFNLDEILGLDPADLSNEQKAYLVDNKEQLSDDDVAKFGLSEDASKNKDDGGKQNGDEGKDKKGKEEGDDEDKPFDANDLKIETRGKKAVAKANDGGDGGDDDDDDLLPEDKKAFEKFASKLIKPLQDEIQALKGNTGEQQHIIDTDSFLAENPDYKKYRSGILKYAKDPAYSNVAISNIAIIVSAKDQQALGAKKEREAQAKAKASQSQGNQGGQIIKDKNKNPDYLNMSKEDFEKERARVLGQVA